MDEETVNLFLTQEEADATRTVLGMCTRAGFDYSNHHIWAELCGVTTDHYKYECPKSAHNEQNMYDLPRPTPDV